MVSSSDCLFCGHCEAMWSAAQGVWAHRGLLWDVKSTHSLPQGFLLSLRGSLQHSDRGDERGRSRERGPEGRGSGQWAWGAGSGGVSSREEFSTIGTALRLQSIFTVRLGQRQGAITVLISLRKKMSSKPLAHLLPGDTMSRGAKIGISSSSLRRDLGNAENLTLLSLGHTQKISRLSLSSGDSFRASRFRAQI